MPPPTPPLDQGDRVALRVPADARYARVVRVAVGAYAVRLGLPPSSVEDLRLAVDEALILLLGAGGGADAPDRIDPTSSPTEPSAGDPTIVVTLDSDGDRPPVAIEIHLDPGPAAGDHDAAALARFEELIPVAVAVDLVDPVLGRVALHHPA